MIQSDTKYHERMKEQGRNVFSTFKSQFEMENSRARRHARVNDWMGMNHEEAAARQLRVRVNDEALWHSPVYLSNKVRRSRVATA